MISLCVKPSKILAALGIKGAHRPTLWNHSNIIQWRIRKRVSLLCPQPLGRFGEISIPELSQTGKKTYIGCPRGWHCSAISWVEPPETPRYHCTVTLQKAFIGAPQLGVPVFKKTFKNIPKKAKTLMVVFPLGEVLCPVTAGSIAGVARGKALCYFCQRHARPSVR